MSGQAWRWALGLSVRPDLGSGHRDRVVEVVSAGWVVALILVAFGAGCALGVWYGKALGERDEARRNLEEFDEPTLPCRHLHMIHNDEDWSG